MVQTKKYCFCAFMMLCVAIGLQAQELTVKSLEVAPMDLTASTQPRNDLNGNPCGLVKVLFPTVGVTFEGNVLGDVAFKAGEYWVYMSEGSYMLNVKHPNFYPLMVNFRDYDIKKVEGKVTYVLTIGMPQTNAVEKKQKLTVNYSPTSAIVMIDSKPYQGNGHLELELPVGSHDYQIIAMGYVTAEGSLKLNEDAPKTITEHLVATTIQPQQQQSQEVVQQLADAFEGKTASEMKDIGLDYYSGRNGKKQDYAEAVRWWRKAAELGNAYAQYDLGLCYKNGQGVSVDYAEAVKWYRKAAEQGHAKAQHNLGNSYYNGQGVTQDYAEAVKWYRKAAEQGHANAQYNLAICYRDGRGVAQDYAETVKWYRKAAEQGYAAAQCSLGWCYENSRGVTLDYAEAVKWYRKAAEQVYALAQNNLGLCYYNGHGVAQDYAEAVKWFRKAVEQGNADAQCSLGHCYYNGLGVTKDKDKARELWRKAAAQAHETARDNLKKCFNE